MKICILTFFLLLQFVFLNKDYVILVSSVATNSSLVIHDAFGCFKIMLYLCCTFTLIVVLVIQDFLLSVHIFHVLG